jgi:hypothetical protein
LSRRERRRRRRKRMKKKMKKKKKKKKIKKTILVLNDVTISMIMAQTAETTFPGERDPIQTNNYYVC